MRRSSCSRSGSRLERVRHRRRGEAHARGVDGGRPYRLEYRALDERIAANATEIRAELAVTRGDRDLGTLEAGKNAYTIEEQVSNEVGIRSDPLTGEDLFVIAEQIDPDGTVTSASS